MLCDKYRDFTRMSIYQIYPRSFMDSNGDGIGDIRGIIGKLDYLQELGVNAIWMCPCFKSPNADNGYDVADYCDIMDEFGTMADMDELIAEMHSRGMKLILDLVPNHTSSEHRWFRESRKGRDNPYSDFYVWYDEKPNDWRSAFGGSAWEYDELRGQYYLHNFAVGQPDLNWDDPAVVKAMQDVVDFWVDKGIDGFRVDVVDMISKDIPAGVRGMGPRLHEYINALFGREKAAHLFTVGESVVKDIDEMVAHCGEDRGELSTLFQFDHLECGRADKFTPKADSLRSFRDTLLLWQQRTAEHDLLYSLFTDNHDQQAFISRAADDRGLRYESATDVAAMLYLLKGVPFIYQGQEIGMPAAHYDDIACFDDVESLGAYKDMIEIKGLSEAEALAKVNFGSRDNARHPMAWDGSEKCGFTTGEPWLIAHSRAGEINVESDLAADKSVFRFYQQLLRLRAGSDAFLDGELEVISKPEDDHFIYTRTLARPGAAEEKWAVICNFEKAQNIELPFECEEPALANLGRKTAAGGYAPYECAVARVKDFYINDDCIRLHAKLDMPPGWQEGGKCPLAIIIHGFTGHMEETHIRAVARTFNEEGIASLRVEMYGHGQSDGDFHDHNLFKWLNEAMAVTDYAKQLDFVTEMYICGHSQGGITTIMLAGMKPDDFKAALPLSPAVYLADGARKGLSHGQEFDPMHVPEEFEVAGLRLSGNYIRAAQMLDVDGAVERFPKPVLIVHGDEDEAIPVEWAVEASKKFKDCEMVVIHGDDHCYNRHLDEVLAAVRGFLRRL